MLWFEIESAASVGTLTRACTRARMSRGVQCACWWGIAGGIQFGRRAYDLCAQQFANDFESGPAS